MSRIRTYLRRFMRPLGLALLLSLLAAAGCVAPAPPQARPILRVALLPITDVIPFYVAQSQDYFSAEGLAVTLIPVSSGAERDTLIQTDQADCLLTDLHNVILNNSGGNRPLQVIGTAHQATPERGQFFLIGAPGRTFDRVTDLQGAQIGISENTIIEYWAARILAQGGLDYREVVPVNVAQIPLRLELLLNGQLDAAVLPDPLASLARLQGGTLLADDTGLPQIAVSVLSCRADYIAAEGAAVTALLRAWDRAVADINGQPDAFQNVLIENTRVPEPLQDRYRLPRYPEHALPSPEQVADVVAWAMEKGVIPQPLGYEAVVNDSFRRAGSR